MNEQPSVSGQVYGGLTTILRVLVFATIAVGILLLARIILLFFGSLKTVPGYEQVVTLTESFIGPLKSIEPVKTPYEGIFDIAATGALLIALVLEFMLQGVQNFLERQQVRSRAPHPAGESAPAADLPKVEDELAKK
jgi:uncharacterized protein YggT (Ycf19 family)